MKCPYLINTYQVTEKTDRDEVICETQTFGECVGEECMAYDDGICRCMLG